MRTFLTYGAAVHRRTLPLDVPLHVADFGGAGRPIVLVHGLGGSHVNWISVGDTLTPHGHVVAIDLIGHGYTPRDGAEATVPQHRELLEHYLQRLDQPAVLVGNSMGGFLALTVAASAPRLVAGLVLVGAALPREHVVPRDPLIAGLFGLYLIPGLARRFLRARDRRLGPEGVVKEVLDLCTVDAARIDDQAWDAHVQMARERYWMSASRRSFLQSTRSLTPRLVSRKRAVDMIAEIEAPALIVHGDRDRLVPVEVARHLAEQRPDWQLEVIDDIGHVPQLEAPDRFLEVVGPWLEQLADSQAAED